MTGLPTRSGMIETDAGMISSLDTVTLIDSLEDQNLTEYDASTAEFDIFDPSFSAVDGTYVLRNQANGSFSEIRSTVGGGLDNYFPNGTIGHVFARSTEANDGDQRVLFGVQGAGNYYNARINYSTGVIEINKRSDAGGFETLATTSASPSADQWYEFIIKRDDGTLGGSNGDIVLDVQTYPGGSTLGSLLSTTDVQFDDEDGIGFVGQSNDTADLIYDFYYHE